MCFLEPFHATGHDSDEAMKGLKAMKDSTLFIQSFACQASAKAKALLPEQIPISQDTLRHYEKGAWKLRGL